MTGAGRGIGRAIALELASLGADVAVAEISQEGAERTADEVRQLGRRAVAIKTDVTSQADLDAMADRTVQELGKIDILVNNAGVNWFGPVLEVTEESWDFVMDVNAKAVFFASQAALRTCSPAEEGQHHQPGLDGREARQHLQRGLRREQGGRHQHHPQPCALGRAARHPGQLRLPRLHQLDRHVAAGRDGGVERDRLDAGRAECGSGWRRSRSVAGRRRRTWRS